MDEYEKEMIDVVNHNHECKVLEEQRNHDCKVLADKLNAISARRRKKGKK